MNIESITALFTASVRTRWENVLTTYFQEIYFFLGIEVEDGKVRVAFRGNPTSFWTAHHRAFLVFDPKSIKLPKIEFGFVLSRNHEDEGLHIRFSNIDLSRITQTPDALMEALHEEITG